MTAQQKEETDEDLIGYMTMKSDASGARGAWRTFYERHVEFVYNAVMKTWGDVFTTTTVDDLVAETMLRAFDRAHTYDPAKSNMATTSRAGASAPTTEEQAAIAVRRVRAWLIGIARKLVMDAFEADKAARRRSLPLEFDDEDDEPPAIDPVPVTGEQVTTTQQILGELDERELAVLRLTGAFHPDRPSPGAMQELALQLRTTPDNLRQIRYRVYDKIDKARQRRGLPAWKGRRQA